MMRSPATQAAAGRSLAGAHSLAAADAIGQLAHRWVWAEIDLGAVAHNVRVMRRAVAPADVWAVVKADGYGHGAVPVARAALDAGCAGVCVALTAEGATLREAGLTAPVLLLSEQPADDAAAIVAHDLTPTVTTLAGIAALERAAPAAGLDVHLKVDTGMHRVGARPDAIPDLVAAIQRTARLRLGGVFTHLAVADEPDDPYTAEQLAVLDRVLAELPAGTLEGVVVHAANSAAALAFPAARRSFVRSGIALYGITPGPGVADRCSDLRPVLSLKARVAFVKRLDAGARLSYGLRYTLLAAANVATVPLGYADGVRRGLSSRADVLIGGRRRRIIGTITMDQLMVDCGDDDVAAGDEVVLIGAQGDELITAEEWADMLGTIGYEVTCGIAPRVPRRPA